MGGARWRGWAIAAAALAAATALRWVLDPWLADRYPLVMLVGAVAVTAFFAGVLPATVAAAAGYGLVNYFFLQPRHRFEFAGAEQLAGLIAYAITAACVIATGAAARRYHRQLAESSRRKSEFLAVLGHELRSPLSAVVNGAQVLRMRADDERAVRTAELIQRQARHLTRLVDDLLDLSRIEQGTIRLQLERVALQEVVHQAAEATAGVLRSGGHRLEVELAEPALELNADGHRLAQVLANLLTNAAHYSPQPGEIRLSGRRNGERVTIGVTDHGMGIEPHDMAKLFRFYSRLAPAADRAPGLGVGLALSRSLIELHGGTIDVKSDGRGKGSCFTVTLPLDAAMLPPAGHRPATAA
jgi:signal transduction histidine kinase